MSSHASLAIDHASEFRALIGLEVERGVRQQPIRERLMQCLPSLSVQAAEVLLTRCLVAVQRGHGLARRVQARILTRREASFALYDQFPGLTRRTADRIIDASLER